MFPKVKVCWPSFVLKYNSFEIMEKRSNNYSKSLGFLFHTCLRSIPAEARTMALATGTGLIQQAQGDLRLKTLQFPMYLA